MPKLKLRKLPDRAPVRLTIALSPDLHRLLAVYASLYQETYGEEEGVAELVPFIVQSFLDSDREFQRECRERRLV